MAMGRSMDFVSDTTVSASVHPPPHTTLEYKQLDLSIDGVKIRIAAILRDGPLAPVIFLHGFGSSKEDYLDMAHRPQFTGRPFVAFDFPGCGGTTCEDLKAISIPFFVKTTESILQRLDIRKFHLVGHSMGGLTGLMLALQNQDRVLSFIDIKGNLAPEDCFLSRQIFSYPLDDPDDFLKAFISRTHRSPGFANALYAAGLPSKVHAGAVRGIFESMVRLSDEGDLLSRFIKLTIPRIFMYGEDNADLSYLKELGTNDIELAEIPQSGHFPMYSNPIAMWSKIYDFWSRCDRTPLPLVEA